MKIAVVIVRTVTGLLFLLASVTFFLNLVPQPELAGKMKLFSDGISASGCLLPLVKTIELLCGIAFIANRFVPLAVVLIAPIAVNILLINTFLAPAGFPIAALLFLAILFLAFVHRKNYEPLLAIK